MLSALAALAGVAASCGVSYLSLQYIFDKEQDYDGDRCSSTYKDVDFDAFSRKIYLHEFILNREDKPVTYILCCDHCMKPMRGENYGHIFEGSYPDNSTLTASVAIYTNDDSLLEAVKELHLCQHCRSEFMKFLMEYLHLGGNFPAISAFCFNKVRKEEQTPLDSGSRPE